MTYFNKTLLLFFILVGYSCSTTVVKSDAKDVEKISSAPKADSVENIPANKAEESAPTESDSVIQEAKVLVEPKIPVEPVSLDLTGTWKLRIDGELDDDYKFRFCNDGAVWFHVSGERSKYEKFRVFEGSRLHLVGKNRKSSSRWLFRSVDTETFEIARVRTCPANKKCFTPSLDRDGPPDRYERVSREPRCDRINEAKE